MLPFDADTLFATLTQYHRAFWPLQWLALVAAGRARCCWRSCRRRGSERVVPLLLAAGWLWVGLAWHLGAFAGINFAAPLYGVLFVLQAAILAWIGGRGRVAFRFRPGLRGWAGLGLAGAAIIGYPLADRLGGAPWSAVRLPGAAPCPTALLTLGVLLLAEGRRLLWPMLIPALWTLVAGFTGYVLTIGPDQLLPLAGAAALVVAISSDRRGRSLAARRQDLDTARRERRGDGAYGDAQGRLVAHGVGVEMHAEPEAVGEGVDGQGELGRASRPRHRADRSRPRTARAGRWPARGRIPRRWWRTAGGRWPRPRTRARG